MRSFLEVDDLTVKELNRVIDLCPMTVTNVEGFSASGVASGIKSNKELDLALVATEDRKPVSAAGVFTSNKVLKEELIRK